VSNFLVFFTAHVILADCSSIYYDLIVLEKMDIRQFMKRKAFLIAEV